MRIEAEPAEGEFRHVGLGEYDAAGGAQTPHHRRILRGGLAVVGENFRAGARHFTGDVEQILDRDDRAIERPQRDAGTRARIGGVGRGPRFVAIERQTGARTFALGIVNSSERLCEPFNRRSFPHRTDLLDRVPRFSFITLCLEPTLFFNEFYDRADILALA